MQFRGMDLAEISNLLFFKSLPKKFEKQGGLIPFARYTQKHNGNCL